jgi:hypothetical protein
MSLKLGIGIAGAAAFSPSAVDIFVPYISKMTKRRVKHKRARRSKQIRTNVSLLLMGCYVVRSEAKFWSSDPETSEPSERAKATLKRNVVKLTNRPSPPN